MNSIERHVGNLLDVTTGIIVHGCNARGVMGAGVAAAIKARYPGAYAAYRRAHEECGLAVGQVIAYPVPNGKRSLQLVIAHAIIQENYGTDRRQVDYAGLERAFVQVAHIARTFGFRDVHFPLIGCGLAGGDWRTVEPIIKRTLRGLHKHLWVLE
ncbi:MAG: macro domain-containing protein [Steroidobacteraceae bacterium]